MRITACIVLAACLTASAFAQEFKGVTYKSPPGWTESVEGDAKIFTPNDLKEGDLLAIILTRAVPSNGSSWEKQFTDTIALANDGGKASEATGIQKREASGRTLLMQTLKLDHKKIGKHSRLYAQVSQGEQRVFVTVLINKDELLAKYGEAVSDFLAGLGFTSAPAAAKTATGRIPTGNTPNLFPGSPGWLPSGQGVPIPAPAIANGKPAGLWWKFIFDPVDSKTKAVIHVYLPSGIRASNPRPGAGMLYDVQGQRAQKGNTGVGTFAISGGQIVEKYDGFEKKAAFTAGSDKRGKLFKVGGAAFRPFTPVTNQSIVAQWKGPGVDYKFKADGTYETGMTHSDGNWAGAYFDSGTYVLDGYLLMLVPKKAPSFISLVGKAGDQLVIGSTFYEKR